ncbi:MAG: fibronectin type III domain-containing protein, partial [Taibaiella sp.]|nr:fibronectin type III domain-containing protein [Taibaiella sp.]
MFGCQTSETTELPVKTVSDVISDAVTKIYDEGREALFADYNQEDVLREFNEEEKQILATQYWVFDINQEADIYVCRDEAQQEVPFWLPESGFEKTGYEIKNKFNTYEVWKKTFPAGKVQLGINGFDRHNFVYFTVIKPVSTGKPLVIEPVFPEHQIMNPLHEGSYTYFDWDELVITELPAELEGATLMITNRGRAREAHLTGNAFRETDFPSSDTIDQILLTWSADPKTTMTLGWRTSTNVKTSTLQYWEAETKDT